MGVAIGVTIVLLVAAILGIVLTIWKCRGAWRIVLPILSGLFALICLAALAVEYMVAPFLPEELNMAEYKGPKGSVGVPIDGDIKIICHDNGKDDKSIILSGKNHTVPAPVGRFSLSSYVVNLNNFIVSGGWGTPSAKANITVRENAQTLLNVGPPYTATVSVEQSGDEAEISLAMVGMGGESVSIHSQKAPGFQVLGKNGEVLWTGSFAYG